VSQTMSCQTASRRSGAEEPVSSTTATMDLQSIHPTPRQSLTQIHTLRQPHLGASADVNNWLAGVAVKMCRYMRHFTD